MRSTLTERNNSNSATAGSAGSSSGTSCCSASSSTSRTTLLVEDDLGDIILLPPINGDELNNTGSSKGHSSSSSHSLSGVVLFLKRRPKRTLLVGAGVLLVFLMSIQTSLFKQRSLSSFLSPFVFSSKYKDSLHTNPFSTTGTSKANDVISWTMTPTPFDEPTYDEIYNRAYQCVATPPNWKPQHPWSRPRVDLREDIKSQVWFHTSIQTNLNILVMGDSVAMQIGELLQEAMNIDDRTRTILRLLEPGDDINHESLFWGTSPEGGGGSGGYRLLHWWLRRNHGKPLPETSGGGWILEDVDQLLQLIQQQKLEHNQRHGPRRLREYYPMTRRRRIEDDTNSREKEESESESESEEDEERKRRNHHPQHPQHHPHPQRRDPEHHTREKKNIKKRRDPRADAKEGRRPRPGGTTSAVKGGRSGRRPPPLPSPPTKTSYTTTTKANNNNRNKNMRTGPPPRPPPGAKQQQRQQKPPPQRVVLPKDNVASDFRTKHHMAGTKVDVLVFRVSQPWMHWNTMTPDNMEKTIQVAKELLGVKVVIFLTIPYSNNIVDRNDIQQMSQTNNMIRQFVTQRQQQKDDDGVTALFLDMARLTDTLLKENAVQQGYNVKEEEQEKIETSTTTTGWSLSSASSSLPWPVDNYDFTLDTLVQSADYYSHSIPHVCADRVLPNSEDCNNRNMLTYDGQHLCMKTFGGRFFAGMACVIRCAYTYDTDDTTSATNNKSDEELLDCQRACNDQYMSLQPLEDSFFMSPQ